MVRPPDSWLSALARAVTYTAFALQAAPVLFHLARGADAYLGLFADDHFYYVLIADHWLRTGWPSFDGHTATNGFHPLFAALLVLVDAATGGTGPSFHAVLTLLGVAASIATYELYRALGRQLFPQSRLTHVLAAIVAIAAGQVIQLGMEVLLAIPLEAALLVAVARRPSPGPRQCVALGALASLLVLARIDAGEAVLLLALAYFIGARASGSQRLRVAIAFGLGGVALPAWLVWSQLHFGTPWPVSALAKSLWARPGFNYAIFQRTPMVVFGLLLAATGLLTLWRRRRVLRPEQALAAGTALAFPLVFYLVYAWRSPWSLWEWYSYPLWPAFLIVPPGLVTWLRPAAGTRTATSLARLAALLGRPCATAALLSSLWLTASSAAAATVAWQENSSSLLSVARQLAPGIRARGGRHAMGDRAGMVAYLAQRPILQLEGLAADRAFVDHLRRGSDLPTVLDAYDVDYLIVSLYEPLHFLEGCADIEVPDHRHVLMGAATLAGRVCGAPIETQYLDTGKPGPEARVYSYVFARHAVSGRR